MGVFLWGGGVFVRGWVYMFIWLGGVRRVGMYWEGGRREITFSSLVHEKNSIPST